MFDLLRKLNEDQQKEVLDIALMENTQQAINTAADIVSSKKVQGAICVLSKTSTWEEACRKHRGWSRKILQSYKVSFYICYFAYCFIVPVSESTQYFCGNPGFCGYNWDIILKIGSPYLKKQLTPNFENLNLILQFS